MTGSRKGFWLTVAAILASSGFLTAYKIGATLGDPTDAALVMLTAAALLNSGTSTLQERGRRTSGFDRLSVVLAVALACLTLVGNEFAAGAVFRISAPLASVMQQTQVVFVALLGSVILRERVTVRFWIGAAIAASGLWVLQMAPSASVQLDEAGALMAVGSAFCFGVMAVLTRLYIHRIRPVAVNALRLWMSIALWFLVHRRLPHLPLGSRFVAYCALAGVFGPFLSRTALMYALSYVSPTRTTLMALATPLLTLVPAYFAFGSVPSPRELVGGAVMIAGIALPLLERQAAEGVAVPDVRATAAEP